MKTSRTRAVLTFALVLAVVCSLGAADLGQPAPLLKIGEWIKGTPIDFSEGKGKNIYVVDFWATWSGPCRVVIPHLTKLQKRFGARDVVFVGISDEPADTVKPFVERLSEKMGYRVAIDTSRSTHAAYLEAFGVRSIPHAFVVDKNSVLAWHGHPMLGLDKVLEEILAGRFDLESARRSLHAEQLAVQYFSLLRAGGNDANAKELGNQVLDGAAKNPALLNEFAWSLLTDNRIKVPDLDLALRAAKLAYDATSGNDPAVVDTYARAMFRRGRKAEAIKLQKEAIAICKDERTRAQLETTLKEYQDATKP
jgi:thiol-disulfide isomerase/thioredoxin